jgi:hypothetical protein
MHVISLKPLQLLEAWCAIEREIAKKKKTKEYELTIFK